MRPQFNSAIEKRDALNPVNLVLNHLVDIFSVFVILAALWQAYHQGVSYNRHTPTASASWFAEVLAPKATEPVTPSRSAAAATITPIAAKENIPTYAEQSASSPETEAKAVDGSAKTASFGANVWSNVFASQNHEPVDTPTKLPKSSSKQKEKHSEGRAAPVTTPAFGDRNSMASIIWNTIFAKQEFEVPEPLSSIDEQYAAPVVNLKSLIWNAFSNHGDATQAEDSSSNVTQRPATSVLKTIWNRIMVDQGSAEKPISSHSAHEDYDTDLRINKAPRQKQRENVAAKKDNSGTKKFPEKNTDEAQVYNTEEQTWNPFKGKISDTPTLQDLISVFVAQEIEQQEVTKDSDPDLENPQKAAKKEIKSAPDQQAQPAEAEFIEKSAPLQSTFAFIASNILAAQTDEMEQTTNTKPSQKTTGVESVHQLLLSLNEAAQAGSKFASKILSQFFTSILTDQDQLRSESGEYEPFDMSALFVDYFAYADDKPETWDSPDKAVKSFLQFVERSARSGSKAALKLMDSIIKAEVEETEDDTPARTSF